MAFPVGGLLRPEGAPRVTRVAILALNVSMLLCFAWFVLGVGGSYITGWKATAVNNAPLLLAGLVAALRPVVKREERLAWTLVAIGVTSWALGELYWGIAYANGETAPLPSVSDAFWLATYPPVYAAIVILARRRVHSLNPRAWIDGLIAALAVAGLASMFALEAVVNTLGGDPVAIAVNLAYPIADTLLLALLAGIMVGARGQIDRTWWYFALGMLVFAVSDTTYVFRIAAGSYTFPSPMEMGWVAGCGLVGLSAWVPARRVGRRVERDHGIVVPIVLAVVSLVLLIVDHFNRAPVYSVALASGSLVLVFVRLLLSHGDSRQNLRHTRRQAVTDSLTGLGNRLGLMQHLDEICEREDAAAPHLLLLFDLDGFKNYNDSFGHPAGDILLRRLGQRLGTAVAPEGRAFRMGGDEFCVVVPLPAGERVDVPLERARAALIDEGEGFRVGASAGHVVLPTEAADSAEALRAADRRLYAEKNSGRMSARLQSMRVLSGAMREWDADLGDHGHDVAGLAEQVARSLGLDEDDVERVIIAAELHDIGKIAVPRSILLKPGKLDADEWAFMRKHTVIGERIVQSAPALASVGKVIRSSHERWDGHGYPDGLAGDDIPLASQIVFACDAFAAMTADRSYRDGMSEDAAIAELRSCAGTQFSPRAVAALCGVLAAERQAAPIGAAVTP